MLKFFRYLQIKIWRLWCTLSYLLLRQATFSLSSCRYWMSGNDTISRSSSGVVYLIAYINFGSAQNAVFAVSRICERIRFGRDVNTDVVIGICTLIGNSVIIITILTTVKFNKLALLLLPLLALPAAFMQ